MNLIPKLPNDIARECLIRVSYEQFPTLLTTSKGWKTEIELPEFFHRRQTSRHGQKLIVLAQARVDSDKKKQGGVQKGCFNKPVYYRLSVLELDTGKWIDLPNFSNEFSDGLPYFCQLVAVGFDLIVIGGFNPVTWEVSGSVFVFNFLTAKWRRGADMPGVRRSMFGCASGDDRMVYVAGGHDEEKNALKSALAYDVANDDWIRLPDMTRERDECKGVFHRGKFHVVGGYHTDTQGRFEKSADVFDVNTWQWNHVRDDFLKTNTCPKTCIGGYDVDMYMTCENDVVALKDAKWQVIAELPYDVSKIAYMTTWQDKLVAIGGSGFGRPHNVYVLNLKKSDWTKFEIPEEYSGHVQSGCYLEI